MFIFSLYLTARDDFCPTDRTSEQQVALVLLTRSIVAPAEKLFANLTNGCSLTVSDGAPAPRQQIIYTAAPECYLGLFQGEDFRPDVGNQRRRKLVEALEVMDGVCSGSICRRISRVEPWRSFKRLPTLRFHPSLEERFLYTVLSRARTEFWVKYNTLVTRGLSASLMNEIKNFSRRLKELQEDVAEHFIWCFMFLFSDLHIMRRGNKWFSQWNISMNAPVHKALNKKQ